MTIDGKVLARAKSLYENEKSHRQRELDRRRAEIYDLLPEARQIESRLRQLVINAAQEALAYDGDPEAQIDSIARESLDLQIRLSELLVGLGYPYDWLDENPACGKCGDRGYTNMRMCSCLKDLYDSEMTAQLSSLLKLGEETFETFDLGYYSPEPAPDTSISPRKWMETIYLTCKNYADKFGKSSPNLLFQGDTGLGKTFLSASIARVVAGRGYSVVYDTAVSAIEVFENQKFRREESEDPDAEARRYLDCDLLILDDLGTEMTTAFTTSALYNLINTRLITGKKTIISTNLKQQELLRKYSPQIVSRLEGEYHTLTFVGSDIRLLKKDLGIT